MFKENKWLRTDNLISDELSIFEVGYEDVRTRAPYQYEQLDYYLIHFIVHGEGLFSIENETHQLGRGDGFVIPPYTNNNYYPLAGNPWSYRWIGVRGTAAKKIFKNIGLGSGTYVYHHDDVHQLDQLFADVFDFFANDHLYGSLGKFYEIVSLLTDDYHQRSRVETTPEQQYMIEAVKIIQSQYTDPNLQIGQIAEIIKIERSYLYKIFMRHLAISPKTYLLQYRINQSTQLLLSSNLSIAEIATQTGFSNYSQFSKSFSKYRHISPTAFRKQFISDEIVPFKTWIN
ncbi:AraC family transcriptional regulator [Lapidilactobacillus dextrinicus]|uniref:AraC family transcriptional regulator n=1 Tax=Lapidilactobacillus dextrinicus TaxID=51664 RepID=UPI003F1F1CAF